MQSRDTIATRARELVAAHLDIDPAKITDDASFVDDLGADSLDVVEIAMFFEEEWDIEISDDDVETVKVFRDAVDYLVKRLGVEASVAA